MVLLIELDSTAHGLKGTTVDEVVIQLSEPRLDIIDVRGKAASMWIFQDPEEKLRQTDFRFMDDSEFWSSDPDFEEERRHYIKDASTDPLHFFQLGTIHPIGETRVMAAIAIYREWGLTDPRQGEYFKWHKEKELIRQTFERGVEPVLTYIFGCVFGGTLRGDDGQTEEIKPVIRQYIDRLRQEVLKPETDQQRWLALLDVSGRIGPRNIHQEFWPNFKYIQKEIFAHYK